MSERVQQRRRAQAAMVGGGAIALALAVVVAALWLSNTGVSAAPAASPTLAVDEASMAVDEASMAATGGAPPSADDLLVRWVGPSPAPTLQTGPYTAGALIGEDDYVTPSGESYATVTGPAPQGSMDADTLAEAFADLLRTTLPGAEVEIVSANTGGGYPPVGTRTVELLLTPPGMPPVDVYAEADNREDTFGVAGMTQSPAFDFRTVDIDTTDPTIHYAVVTDLADPDADIGANLSVFGYRANGRVSMGVSLTAADTRLGSEVIPDGLGISLDQIKAIVASPDIVP